MEIFNQEEVTGDDIRQILKKNSLKNKSDDPIVQSLMTTTNTNQNDISYTNSNINARTDSEPIETLINVNNNLRANIKLGLAIYKKLNNFDHNYIHELFNQEIPKTTK